MVFKNIWFAIIRFRRERLVYNVNSHSALQNWKLSTYRYFWVSRKSILNLKSYTSISLIFFRYRIIFLCVNDNSEILFSSCLCVTHFSVILYHVEYSWFWHNLNYRYLPKLLLLTIYHFICKDSKHKFFHTPTHIFRCQPLCQYLEQFL